MLTRGKMTRSVKILCQIFGKADSATEWIRPSVHMVIEVFFLITYSFIFIMVSLFIINQNKQTCRQGWI